jgi:cytochrome c5
LIFIIEDIFVKNLKMIVCAMAMLVSSLTSVVLQAGSVEDGIVSRIHAVGSICIEGEDCAKVMTIAAAGPRSAEDVYNKGCLACHASGAAGAPKFRIAADWTARLALGMDSLYSNAINGKGAMPARGLCPNCSDDEVKAAVDYMIEGL